MRKIKALIPNFCSILLGLLGLCCSLLVLADDTDIFLGSATSTSNILFIIDNSESMLYPAKLDNGQLTGKNRLKEAQIGFESILKNLSGVNVGLMIFGQQGAMLHPVVPLNATSRTSLIQAVRGLSTKLSTPIVGSLYEAQQYFAGKPVYWGLTRAGDPTSRVSHPSTYTTGNNHQLPTGCNLNAFSSTACASETISATPKPFYISPITSNCQSNHIVLFTDGAPHILDHNHVALRTQLHKDVNQLTGSTTCQNDAPNPIKKDQKCGRTLAGWMANNPANPAFNQSKIITHTIAFNLDNPDAVLFLQNIAEKGQGSFHSANSASELVKVLTNVIEISTNSSNTLLVSSAITVNQFNRLLHRNELYFSVFNPSRTPRWTGNLKRYELGGNPMAIRDQSGNDVIDPDTGNFSNNSRSFWSPSTDGGDAALGGAASQLPLPASRKLYTYLPAVSSPSKQLTHPVNQLDVANTEITNTMLTANTAVQRTELLNWIRGVDTRDQNSNGNFTDARQHMGDPLHSVPLLVTYGGTDTAPDISIFVGTNEGFLHAFDSTTGVEQFAFMPEALLKNINPQMANASGQPHVFGMDGSPVVWRKDVDGDQQIRRNQGDLVYVYSGMRRGGRDYYALDVTERANPLLLWQIQGGSGDFQALGQTWSTPIKTKIKLNGVIKDVLIFAGGFDPIGDNRPGEQVKATMGNAIYIVDALTGQRLWMAGKNNTTTDGLVLAEMQYAIPSNLEVIDTDHDGLMDQFYVGDLGGQIWRFDLNHQGANASNLVKGGRIAELGDKNSKNSRQFFFKPDVSLIAMNGGIHTTLAIGSGELISPLSNATKDHFYLLYLNRIDEQPDYDQLTPLKWTDLVDRSNAIDDVTIAQGSGWSGLYVSMEGSGEKVLAPSLTFNQSVLFTTYTPAAAPPPTPAGNSCTVATGTARYYVINLANGNPVRDMDADGDIDKLDRSRLLKTTSIPTQPRLLFVDDELPVGIIGAEIPDLDLGTNDNWVRSYWYKPE